MNTFHSLIFIENTVAKYEITKEGDAFCAVLIHKNSSVTLPKQLLFWKDSGKWQSNHQLKDHALYQFGYKIDNHILSSSIDDLKRCAA